MTSKSLYPSLGAYHGFNRRVKYKGHVNFAQRHERGCANGRRSDVMTSLRLIAKVVIDNEARDHVRNHHAVWQLFLLGLHC